MNKKHYKIRKDRSIEFKGRTLYRIEALKDLPQHDVKKGDIGGYVESYNNLDNNAWVLGDAKVFEDAQVFGDAQVSGSAEVYGAAWVYGDAAVSGHVKVFGNAEVFGNAQVFGDAEVYGYADVLENAEVFDYAKVYGNALVTGYSEVCGHARAFGDAEVFGRGIVAKGDIKKPGDVKNIAGEKYNITILPDHIQIGCQVHTRKEWRNFKDREILRMDGKEGLKWWKKWKPILMAISEIEG